jgi:hypothetical protein
MRRTLVQTIDETPIDQLAALQEFDRRLRDKAEVLRVAENEIAELEGQLARQREATRAAQAERSAAEGRHAELEARLEGEEAKMTDRRMRLNRVRNEKELLALRREIEVSKEANQQLEEELLRVMESLDTLTAAALDAETRLAELEAASLARISERQAEITRFLVDLTHDREARDKMAGTLDQGLRQKYEQIFERRGGTAVVEVRNGTCQGCHMNLPPQLFNELQRCRDIRSCPNCHRILYWRAERLEPTPAAR